MKGDGKLQTFKYAQADAEDEFAEGLGENESIGETIRINGNGKQEKFSYAQAEDEWETENEDLLMVEAFGQKVTFKLAGPKGPALPKSSKTKRRNHYPIKRAQDLVD